MRVEGDISQVLASSVKLKLNLFYALVHFVTEGDGEGVGSCVYFTSMQRGRLSMHPRLYSMGKVCEYPWWQR